MDSEIRKFLLTLILALGAAHSYAQGYCATAAIQEADADIKVLVHQLWSRDVSEEISAKVKLSKIGLRAAPHLISLLTDLAAHSALPHFATNKAVERGKHFREPEAGDPREYEITWRLIYDCVDLLGDMKCAEAVPLIVQVMVEHPTMSMFESFKPDMKALVKIGEPAIEPLLDAIKNAAAIAEAVEADPARAPVADATGPPAALAVRIRVRAAKVMGEIGDPRALPILEDLLKPGAPFEHGDVSVQSAIEKIRSRAK